MYIQNRTILRHILRPFLSSLSYTSNFSNSSTTHFGFKEVPEAEKETLVGDVFRNVANHYDRMNDAMSLGIHRCWKDMFIQKLNPRRDTTLLDVAGGTGDIAFRFLNFVDRREPPIHPLLQHSATFNGKIRPSGYVKVIDINESMLKIGQSRSTKFLSSSQLSRISWEQGNAENLTNVKNDMFDAYTISFGIRNCTHIDLVLKEAYRVLKPGGRFLCLEFSTVENPILKLAYDSYSFQIIPLLGKFISDKQEEYQYLVESIRKFPSQGEFTKMIENAGFRQVYYENLTGGIAAIHSGIKL